MKALVWAALALTLAAVALAPLGCRTAPPAPVAVAAARFVGNAACEPCHAKDFQKHRKSRHGNTFRPATAAALGTMAPPTGPIAGTTCVVRQADGVYFLRNTATGKEIRLDVALGSGKSVLTFVGLDGAGGLDEGRMSYVVGKRTWCITPGQEVEDPDSTSFKHPPTAARRCFSCHTVSAGADLSVAPGFRGVGCESCHGPGSEHIAAAQRKDRDLKIEKMGSWGATQINESCGKCHRAPEMVSNHGLEIAMTNRFQSYGFSLSPCFQKSADKFSCITCHDPHDDASTSPKDYEAVCLTCHAPATKSACPVNPTSACIGCHMPTRPVFPKSNAPVKMADHLIWAWAKHAPGRG